MAQSLYVVLNKKTGRPYVFENRSGECVTLYYEPLSALQFLDYVERPEDWYVREVTFLYGEVFEKKD